MPDRTVDKPAYPDRPLAKVASIVDTYRFAITGGARAGMKQGLRVVVGPPQPIAVKDPEDGTVIGYLVRPKASGHIEVVADQYAVVVASTPVAHPIFSGLGIGLDIGDWVFAEGELPSST